MKYFVVTEEIPLIRFRSREGAEDYVERLMEMEEGVYDIQEVDFEPCPHHEAPFVSNGEIH